MENSMEKWRAYFDSSNTDIFDIIENAIVVAACDRPYDFKLKRDRIAETLFSCKLTKCIGCDVGNGDGLKKSADILIESRGSKESKTNEIRNMDVEELTDEESQIFGDILRIKEILDNTEEQPEALLIESLRRLQLMAISVETLKFTEVGKSVNGIRKHGSKQVRDLVKTLLWNWKNMIDAWFDATQAIADAEVEAKSVKTSIIEKQEVEGLPSPPLDEKVELKSDEEVVLRKKPVPCRPNRPGGGKRLNVSLGPGGPKPTVQPKVNNETKFQQKSNKGTIQNKPIQKSNAENEALDKTRLETTKRKLHERYQEAENAKKRRRIQVVELCDLPKQSLVQRNNRSK